MKLSVPLLILATLLLGVLVALQLFHRETKALSRPKTYIHGGSDIISRPKEKTSADITYSFYYELNDSVTISLVFDRDNIGLGQNYEFVEFMSWDDLFVTQFSYKIKFEADYSEFRNLETVTHFYIYDFKKRFPKRFL